MTRIFFFILGFIFLTTGITFIILYLNILSYEYNFLKFVKYIFSRVECNLTFLGLIIINLSIFLKGNNKYGIHL